MWIYPLCNFLYCILTTNYTYENPHCAINVLYFIFWDFVMNCENQEWVWLKFHKFPSFNDIIKSKKNEIVDGKLVRPAIPCRVCFWPATKERLPTPGPAVGAMSGTNSQKWPKTCLTYDVTHKKSKAKTKQFFIHCTLEDLPSLFRFWTAL